MIFLAVRYLVARRRQTLLMLLGVFFGSAAFVLISGVMLGFRGYLVNQLINTSGHIHIAAREEFLTDHSLDASFYGPLARVFWRVPPSGRKDSAMIEQPQAWYQRLKADPRVVAFSPQLTAGVLFSKGKATATATLIGCDPEQQVRVTTIGDYVTAGRFQDVAAGGGRLALGEELRRKLGVNVGQDVRVSLGPAGGVVPFRVAAVFTTGNRLLDELSYGALADVQKVNGTPNQVNEIVVRLADHALSAQVATTWAALSPEKVESWDQRNAYIFDVFKIQDTVRYSSIGAVMIVAAFGIYNVLAMTVMQKRRDIAILRSMGYSTRDIVVLFLSQGLLLGLSGTSLGLLAGYVISFYLETIRLNAGPIESGIAHILVSRDPSIYLQAAALAFAAASIASILPARAAGRLPPIEIIRAGAE
ncbi:MAG: ABC transporter permease [Elusimicrobia bacterium]|nr:ABC transporter permease [Elusimicrobiota bacterium]